MMTNDASNLDAWDKIDGVPDPMETRSVVGHKNILDQLCARYASGKIHHAWLLSGPRGIGKATLAARFAGHVLRNPNPENAPEKYVPPPESDAVEGRISRGAHPNLLLMRRPWNERDKKWRSDLTVDEIRRTISFFGTSSAENGWRVAIVDTADDLNASSANALLKILEEPPARTILLILAHLPGRSLSTIRSRCQRLALHPLDEDQIVEAIKAVPMFTDVDENELRQAAKLSGGSVRRTILIHTENGVDLFERLTTLAEKNGQPDWSAIHKLAGELSPANRNEQYRLFLDLTHDFLSQKIRLNARSDSGQSQVEFSTDISKLAGWTDVWEKTRHSAEQTDAYNLDRKQVILNLFSAIHELA
ncbi:MAG: DNA polymerase III subunit delta' [Pseudomonadota bacterium]